MNIVEAHIALDSPEAAAIGDINPYGEAILLFAGYEEQAAN